MKNTSTIIIAENDELLNYQIQKTLQKNGFRVEGVMSGSDAVSRVADNPDSILLLDYLLNDITGKEVLQILEEKKLKVPFIVMTGHGSERTAVEMMKLGAMDYVVKSSALMDVLPKVIKNATDKLSSDKKLAAAKEALKTSEGKYFSLFENMLNGFAYHKIIVNKNNRPKDFVFIEINTTFEKYTGLKRADILNKKATEVMPWISDFKPNLIRKFGKIALNGTSEHFDLFIAPEKKWYSISAYSPQKGYFVTILDDITMRKNMEKKLIETSITDDLTGLLNRRGFCTLSGQQCNLAERVKRNLSLLYIDIDNMKTINDELGHKAGDQALIDTAGILNKTFRKSDIIGRIGGDEFTVLITEPSESDVYQVIIKHLQKNLNTYNKLRSNGFQLSFSMGVAHCAPEKPCSIDGLLTEADKDMYKNKKLKSDKPALKILKGGK